MGYTLTIGEAKMIYYEDDNYLRIGTSPEEHRDAPDHCPYTEKSSSRSPGYIAWKDFCFEAGPDVYAMFYGSGWNPSARFYDEPEDDFISRYPGRSQALLKNHPGFAPLCQDDLKIVRLARIEREKLGKEPGFQEEFGPENDKDPTLARLLWLEFWIQWALGNCKIPILENG